MAVKFDFISFEEIKKFNNRESGHPQIGLLFDYRLDEAKSTPQNPSYRFIEFIVKMLRKAIETSGGTVYFIHPDETPAQLAFLDGLLIPGGRDMNPKFYGQELDPQTKHEPASDLRFERTKRLFLELDVPVLGICWGSQFINVVFGGDLIQHLEQSEQHYAKTNTFLTEKGSILESVIGPKLAGTCYHHQGIGKLGKGVVANCVDQANGLVHGVEALMNGGKRKVLTVIWHPEKACAETDQSDIGNLELFKWLVKEAKDYRAGKAKEDPKM